MAIQLCTLRFLGTFLLHPINVPETIIAFLEQQLELPEVRLQPYLKAHAIRFEHAKLIREHLEYRDFDSIAWLKVARLLYARLLIHDEKNEILFDVVTSELVEQRIVLPGATTISRLINRIRERINTRLYRELAARLTSRQAGRLEALLVVSKGASKSPLEQLRLGPTRISAPGLVAGLGRDQPERAESERDAPRQGRLAGVGPETVWEQHARFDDKMLDLLPCETRIIRTQNLNPAHLTARWRGAQATVKAGEYERA